MSEAESSSLASLISSLLESFRTVPPTAIPPMLDCVLASTGLSPSSLFDSLSDRLVDSVGGVKDKKLDSESCARITGMLVAVCHLLETVGANHESLWLFTWRSFLPLMKMGHELDREFLNQVADLFFGVVEKTNTWDFLEENLVPFLLRSAFFSDGIVRDEESDALLLEMLSPFGPNNNSCVDKDCKLYLEESLPLALSCFLLHGTLDAALGSIENASSGDLFQEKGSGGAERLVVTLLWDLCLLTEQLLLKSSEQRSCTICFLLPIIFKTFSSHGPLNVTINGKINELSRKSFFMKIWACCRTLFSLGSSESRDAYGLLSLFLSLIPSSEISKDAEISNQPEVFDIKTVKEFWNEMKKGLMSDDGLVRKQSLYILKTVLFIEGGSQCDSQFSENKTSGKHSVSHGMTKRDLWADKEAKSLGVGKFCNVSDLAVSSKQQWEAFLLLYEMLEEYGTHLVEAAWNPQITLLLQFSLSHDNFVSAISRGAHLDEKEILDEALSWLSILWKRGFCHNNPQVRCMILQSFLGIDWGQYESCAKSMPESFILGPFLDALDDPVHHSDFGVKGVYSSKTIEGAVNFFHQFAADLDTRRRIAFSRNVAALTKTRSFSRPGLMSLAECIASFGFGSGKINGTEAKFREDAIHDKLQEQYYGDKCLCNDKTDLVGVLRYVIESCKQHFNPNYRLRVCKDVLKAVASLVCVIDVPLEIILHFISALPREFTNNGGLLRTSVQYWLIGNKKHQTAYSDEIHMQFLEKLSQFPRIFISHNGLDQSFNDEDLNAWELEAKRWTRVLLLVAREGHNLAPVLEFIENCCVTIFEQNNQSECMPEKFLILISCLIHEIDEFKEGTAKSVSRAKRTEVCLVEGRDHAHEEGASAISKKFSEPLLLILEKLLPFAYLCCSVFWSRPEVEIAVLPCSVRGKLGGPSQRRLPNSTTTAVLKAIISVKVVAYISRGYAQYGGDSLLQSARSFLWEFFQKTVSCPTCNSETEAEVRLASYEVLAPVLKAFVTLLSPGALHLVRKTWKSLPVVVEGELWVDSLVLSFLQNVNNLLSVGALVRTRRAVLLNWKWLCLESFLLIPTCAEQKGLQASGGSVFFSDTAVRHILTEVTESLENAGEVSVLPMLRSLRMALELVASGRFYSAASAFEAFDTQMIWQLVHSSWILHVNCSKRRVAPIAALLSSILHSSLFSEEDMHVSNDRTGPLKWFVGKLLEEGSKSPRTIRLVALHLTGLWLLNPWTIKYYMKELKLLTLYGSVAFDEDFEAELAESHDSRIEVSLLAKSPDSELTEAFINTELYSRVSVAVLFQKLAALTFVVTASVERKRSQAALPSGKLFLLELMDSVVNDKDLAKELYKKYSAIHRRKVRAWQMICVLSPFVSDDIVDEVTRHLHVALYRNNLPGVRQYLETFGINIYLKFPLLVGEQLVPILRDYDMRPQALASYVFIAANVMLHAPNTVKFRHLDELFPPIIPFLTSHHHSLRGFTQVLVHQVLKRLFPAFDSENAKAMSLEKQCFQDLNLYLENNSDCMRLRSSMEGYLDAYDPKFSVTPAGIFVARAEETGFECVPTSLMEHVLNFLNDAREGLRSSMARDTVKIKNESFDVGEAISFREMFSSGLKEKSLADPYKELMLDYQKKVTLSKHDKEDSCSSDSLWNVETYKQLLEMEKEDDLLDQLLKSRIVTMEKIRGKRQSFILVASLLDRIPNLAGLARTCEVFRASGLAVADTNVVHDKQFQLISVTAEKWAPVIEVPVSSMKLFLEKKKREGFSILGLEQTANSIPLDQFVYPKKTVMVLGHEKEGIPADVIHILDACIEIPQLGVVRSLNVHVSGAIALWEYTRQQRSL